MPSNAATSIGVSGFILESIALLIGRVNSLLEATDYAPRRAVRPCDPDAAPAPLAPQRVTGKATGA